MSQGSTCNCMINYRALGTEGPSLNVFRQTETIKWRRYFQFREKSLKILQKQAETVNRKWTVNRMIKGKMDKYTNFDLQNTEIYRSSDMNPNKNQDELGCFRRVSSSCVSCGTNCVALLTNPMTSHKGKRTRM